MDLKHIERGTKLVIFEEIQKRAISDEHEAVYRYHEDDKLVVVQCAWLYDYFDRLNLGACLNISFRTTEGTNMFTGKAVEKLRGNGLVMIEQLTDMIAISQRQTGSRDEFRVNVRAYGLSEAKINATSFVVPDSKPELTDVSFDLSAGGICVVTETLLSSKYDPYYLVEFTVTDKDRFLLPSKLVRRSNYPRTKIGRYDYGFQFIFDKLPEEKSRLTRAILSRKLEHR